MSQNGEKGFLGLQKANPQDIWREKALDEQECSQSEGEGEGSLAEEGSDEEEVTEGPGTPKGKIFCPSSHWHLTLPFI